MALAAGLQKGLERAVLRLIEPVEAHHRTRHLCLAGGVALNCSLNGVLDRNGPFDRLFVQPAAGDPGAALGAALVAERRRREPVPLGRMATPFLGPAFSTRDVEAALQTHASSLAWERPEDLLDRTLDLIGAGKVVGWFQGHMEFGPRALGNRSILADPRRPDMKDRVNRVVKKREEFRPFAPSVAAEGADAFFHLRGLDQYRAHDRGREDPCRPCAGDPRGGPRERHFPGAGGAARGQSPLLGTPHAPGSAHRRADPSEHLLQCSRGTHRLLTGGRHPVLPGDRARCPGAGRCAGGQARLRFSKPQPFGDESTTSAMADQETRRSRNASTATSLAPLSPAGAVPPARPAR